jgi:heme oxygenase (biliverdin-producing, ferredoxin)
MTASQDDTVLASAALPERLRYATRALHTEVERTGVMRHLLAGRIDRAGYAALLRNLAAIYATMEPLLDAQRDDRWLHCIVDDALFRSAALTADLQVLGGSSVIDPLEPSAQRYRLHLQDLGERSPGLLVAHAYVRYLGDLSGGQVVRRIVAKSLHLSTDAGLRFYDFGDAVQAKALAQWFRQGLAAIKATAAEQEALCAEAQFAFTLHRGLFEELDPDRAQAPADAAKD